MAGATRDTGAVPDTVIPIHAEGGCSGRATLVERPPVLEGDADALQRVIAALQPPVQAELGAPHPVGAWLRSLRITPDEATLRLAGELGCRGMAVATLAFDTLRLMLHDTDIYVEFERR